MTITDVGNLFMFAGGLGMFLYGMHSMSGGIQKTAGNKMKELLGILTSNHFMAVVVGALVTAIIQSSGATTVMVVGFVNAGIMTLTQAVGVIMGANIGTCITAWIVSLGQLGDAFKAFSPSLYAPLLVGIGAFLIMFSKKAKKQTVGEILVGLGLLFIGLDFMGDAAGDYLHLPIFTRAFELFGSNPILGILIGVIVTAIMQSSSAAVGVLQTLAAAGCDCKFCHVYQSWVEHRFLLYGTFVQPWRVTQCKNISCDPSHVQCTRCTGLGQRIVCPVSVPPGFRDNGDRQCRYLGIPYDL